MVVTDNAPLSVKSFAKVLAPSLAKDMRELPSCKSEKVSVLQSCCSLYVFPVEPEFTIVSELVLLVAAVILVSLLEVPTSSSVAG